MSDSIHGVAAAELRQFVERISEPVERLRYCVMPILGFCNDRGHLPSRAFIAAGRLLGMGQRATRRVARDIGRAGTLDAYVGRRQEMCLELPGSEPVDPAELSYVYVARLVEFPAIIKVGFSSDPTQRMKKLRRGTGCSHEIEWIKPGTYFDEAFEFLARRDCYLLGEWFLDGPQQIDVLPDFIVRHASLSEWQRALAQNLAAHSVQQRMAVTPSALNMIYLNRIRSLEAEEN